MESRNIADLLYESEATLRLVDSALDEIRAADREAEGRSTAAVPDGSAEVRAGRRGYDAPSEFRIRAFWQVQEVSDCVRESRELLRSAAPPDGNAAQADGEGAFDRVLSLIDQLDPASASDAGAQRDERLIADLRAEVLSLIRATAAGDERAKNISRAISFLSEAEGRLTQLHHILDAGT